MTMALLDWLIIAFVIAVLIFAAIKTGKFTTSVADFLVANRCAERYILGVSEGMANIGAISIVARFEELYQGGFPVLWWQLIPLAVITFIALSGWVVYRYRQTRVMTLAQFFEMRYSKNFRIFAGITMFTSGIINFGIFPAVGARFFIYFCGFPSCIFSVLGINIDIVYAGIMLILLGLALFFAFAGGQISIMVTDFIQGTFFNILLCLIIVFIMFRIPWEHVSSALTARPPGQSLLNPFDAMLTKDFNIWFYIINAVGLMYTVRAWQGTQGYFGAALNPHEARMGSIMGAWRLSTQVGMLFILPICAYTILHHSGWQDMASDITNTLNKISDNPSDTIRKQVTTTITLSQLLPSGLIGAFCAVMIAAFVGNHETYLHSWGTIFVQDVVMPFRKKALSPDEHIKFLKLSIFAVAVFIFLFSLIFPQNTYIYMFFALSGTIWLAGGGAAIIGGLYWRRGNAAGAYAGVITGLITATAGFMLPYLWTNQGKEFPLNGQWIWLIGIVTSICSYVLVSLLYKPAVYDLDKMLYRGKYAVSQDKNPNTSNIGRIAAAIGIDSDFTRSDKLIYIFITGWTGLWVLIFALGTAWNLIFGLHNNSWSKFWYLFIWMNIVIGVLTTIWFTWGGLRNFTALFKRLTSASRNISDDGTILNQKHNTSDNKEISQCSK